MTFPELIDLWLTPPRFPAPAFPVEPERLRLRLPEQPLPGFRSDYPQALGLGQEVQCYVWENDGPTVLLAHGWGGCAAQYALWIRLLHAQGFRLLAYDAPGHGESEGTYSSAPASAATLRALAQWNSAPLAGIVAHSLGAIATTLALAAGVTCAQVVFLAPVCYVADDLVIVARKHGLAEGDEDALVAYFREHFGADLSVESALERLPDPPPLTLFHDRADESVPYAEAEQIQSAWPGATLVETVRVGHTRILLAKVVVQQASALFLSPTPETSVTRG